MQQSHTASSLGAEAPSEATGSYLTSRKRRVPSGTPASRPPALQSPSSPAANGPFAEAGPSASPQLSTSLKDYHHAPSSPLDGRKRDSPALRKPSTSNRGRSHGNVKKSTAQRPRLEVLAKRAELAVERHFRRHGRYIARHPVHTLLVACLLITSLFYPAVGIFLWSSKGGPGVTRGDARSIWRSLSTPLLDSFASSGRKHHNSLRDLRMIWDDAQDLDAMDARDFAAFSHSMAAAEWLFGGHANAPSSRHGNGVQQPFCKSLRMEHVFVSTDDVIMGVGHRFGALHVPILRSALNLQHAIEEVIAKEVDQRPPDLPACVRSLHDGRCLILSPLAYWANDAERLLEDASPEQSVLASTLNHTAQGVPLTLSTTLAGRSHLFQHLPRADHIAFTFFLEDTQECGFEQRAVSITDEESLSHRAWRDMLRNVTGEQVALLGSEYRSAKETILQFNPKHPTRSFPTHKALLVVAYIGMIVWLTQSFVEMRKVHSKFGLAFTACVELIISMTLAISISALSGVRLTLLPWEMLPFVIAVIGSENTFVLTNAIISTPVTLTVSSRVATGLERAGLPVAITVLSDILLMALISLCVDVRPVRDFCIFAIFALLVDFVMQMTFYATVLTIDMQRLELADLLSLEHRPANASGGDDNESTPSDAGAELTGNISPKEEKSSFVRESKDKNPSFIKLSCRAAWRARTARTASLSFLLALLFGLYIYHGSGYASKHLYDTDGHASPVAPNVHASDEFASAGTKPTFDPFSHLAADGARESALPPQPWWRSSPSAPFWESLNPQHASVLSIKVEPWTVVSLSSASGHQVRRKHSFATWAIFRPRIRALIWFLKLVVLPIAGTTSLLWVLLLYLLKDTELLDAQRDRQDADVDEEDAPSLPNPDDGASMIGKPPDASIYIDASAHTADVLLVASEGKYVVSVALDWTIHLWRLSKRGTRSIRTNLKERLGQSFSQPTAVKIAPDVGLIIVGHLNGGITTLALSTLNVMRSSLNVSQEADAPTQRVQQLVLSSAFTSTIPAFAISVHRDGSVFRRSLGDLASIQMLAAPSNGCLAVPEISSECYTRDCLVAVQTLDHVLNIYRIDESMAAFNSVVAISCEENVVRAVALNHLEDVALDRCGFVVIGTTDGQVILYDAVSRAKYAYAHTLGNSLRHLRLFELPSRTQVEQKHKLILIAATRTRVHVLEIVTSAKQMNGASNPGPLSNSTAEGRLQTNGVATGLHSSDASQKIPSPPLSPARPRMQYALRLMADIDCGQGGAALLNAEDESPTLLGVRRRPDIPMRRPGFQSQETGSDRPRWELFSVSLAKLSNYATSHTKEDILRLSQHEWFTSTSLPLEDLPKSRFPVQATALESMLMPHSPSRGLLSNRRMGLSFSQVAHVQMMPRMPSVLQARGEGAALDTQSGQAGDGIAFVFGNSLCAIAPHQET